MDKVTRLNAEADYLHIHTHRARKVTTHTVLLFWKLCKTMENNDQ